MTRLIPMTADSFARFVDAAVAGHAQDCVAAGRWPADVALANSRAEFDRLLPDGLGTKDHDLFSIVDDADETIAGWIWFAVIERDGARMGFVYDLRVLPAVRRRGLATFALRAVEARARELGLGSVGLHTFGHNVGAQALYRGLGFQTTSVSMVKRLDDEPSD